MGPPFTVTHHINNYVAEICMLIGQFEAITLSIPSPQLRKKNRIKTVKSTLAIEGNSISLEQITAILDNKKVLGIKKEILEVKNAIALYEQIDNFSPIVIKDFLSAHKILMYDLVADFGKFRSKNVGILAGSKVKHVAPKPILVAELMSNLFTWLKQQYGPVAKKKSKLPNSKQSWKIHPLILSAVIHYEIEFIHPFTDGNGRMGRFWQALILKEFSPIFKYIPVENLIEHYQSNYYEVLAKCDVAGDCTQFVEFMLSLIKQSLEEMSSELLNINHTYAIRMEKAQQHFLNNFFSRIDYMELFKNISAATASRDLQQGVSDKILQKKGIKNQTRYSVIKK